MQSLDVISVNLWQILVSLANLIILFLLIKKFLYKPVKKMLETRQQSIDKDYEIANEAKISAEENRKLYEEKLSAAKSEADSVINSAVTTAKQRESEILADAHEKAENILKKAENDAELEKKKAEKEIKGQIIDISTLVAGKIIEKELDSDKNAELVDSFINEIGDE